MNRTWIAALLMVGGCGSAVTDAPPASVCVDACSGMEARIVQIEHSLGELSPSAIGQRLDTLEKRMGVVERWLNALEQDRPLHLYGGVPVQKDLGRYVGGALAYDAHLGAVVDYGAPVELLFEDDGCGRAAHLPAGEADPSRLRIGPDSTWIKVRPGTARPIQVRRRLRATARGADCVPVAPVFDVVATEVEDTGHPAAIYPPSTLRVGP